MNLSNLSKILVAEPAYRVRQIHDLIWRDFIVSWDQATNLSKILREKLELECSIDIEAEVLKSKDRKTVKALITLSDGAKIETVLMRHAQGRQTVCVSSQVGCPLGCHFCATGAMGFRRNLTAAEILEQALFWARYLKTNFSERVTNVVFMGMGEPFLNYDNVLKAIKTLNDKTCFNIGARHISISTVGIVEGIKKLAKEKFQVNLAISLHAVNDKLRSEIIPVNKKYPLTKLFAAIDNYIELTNRQVMFEYLLIKGVNDSVKDAERLAELMISPLYMVNLIMYNDTKYFKAPDVKVIKHFKEILKKQGVRVTERFRFGPEIEAACGQLAGKRQGR